MQIPLFKKIFAFLLLFTGCGQSYDPELEHPDVQGHGFNLTELGCLIYGPWQIRSDTHNVSLLVHDSTIASYTIKHSPFEESLVFELHRDHGVKYWFKYGYDNSWLKQIEKRPNGSETKFESGKWTVNFKDSLLNIEFNSEFFNLPPLNGKYIRLGSNTLGLQKTTTFDSTINNKSVKVTKIEFIYYTHPWVNGFH